MNLREEISSILDAAGIRNALIGALALSAYGINRASLDLDLLAACLKPDLWADLRSRAAFRMPWHRMRSSSSKPGSRSINNPGALFRDLDQLARNCALQSCAQPRHQPRQIG